VKRGLTVAVVGAAIVAAGISGCSSNKTSTGGGGPTVATGGGNNATKVIIDGKDQNVTGSTVCTTVGGTINLAVGGSATGIAAVLTDANPPAVKSIALGNVNGVSLGYTSGTGQGNASATKNGKSYKITGTATGVDMANPTQQVSKPFELDVNCS
jgi:ipoprotein LpqH